MKSNQDSLDLGPCCCCDDADAPVRSIVMLDYKTGVPGTGWGCFQCGLAMEGASYVACDACIEQEREPLRAVLGYQTHHQREPIEDVYARGPHEHDRSLHPEWVA